MVYDEENLAAQGIGVQSIPTLVIVSKEEAVHAVCTGLTKYDELDALVREVL